MRKTGKAARTFLHEKFSERLKQEIKKGRYKPGGCIPSERELLEHYSLSRTTIRRAILQLIREGWLYSLPGTGTFVSKEEPRPLLKSKNIAWVLKLVGSPLDSPYYSKIFRSTQEEAARRGYSFSLYSIMEGSKLDIGRIARERNLAGVIYVGNIEESVILAAVKNNIPLVVIDNYVGKTDITTIMTDNRRGALEAVKYLIKLGHRKIYFFGRVLDDVVAVERFKGYREALAEAAIPYEKEFFIKGNYSALDGYRSMESLLRSKTLPTAVFAINDESAIGAMKAISEKSGLKVPNDMSIIGFDDIDLAAYTNPPLTTERAQKEQMGILAARYLIEQIENKDFINLKVVMPVELIIRSSCSSPAK